MGRVKLAVGGVIATTVASAAAGTMMHEVLDQDFEREMAKIESCAPLLPEEGTEVVAALEEPCAEWADDMHIMEPQPDSGLPKNQQNYRKTNRTEFEYTHISKLQDREDLQDMMANGTAIFVFAIGSVMTGIITAIDATRD